MATKNFDLSLTIKAVDKATGPLAKLSAQVERFTKPFAKFGEKVGDFGVKIGVPKVVKTAGEVGSAFRSASVEAGKLGVVAAGLGAGAAVGAFKLAEAWSAAGETLARTAQQTGLTVDAYAQLEYVAGQAGVSQGEFSSAMVQFTKNLGMAKVGSGELVGLLKVVSPTLLNQVTAAKSSESAFDLMMKAVSKLTDPTKRAALATAAFGDAGAKLTGIVAGGTAEYLKQRKEFERIHGSQEKFALGSVSLQKAIKSVNAAFGGLVSTTGAELFPVFADLGNELTKFIAANRDGIATWAKGAARAIGEWGKGGGIQRLSKTLGDLAKKVGDFIEQVGGLKTVAIAAGAVMAGPLLLAISSLAGPLAQAGVAVAGLGVRLGRLAFASVIASIGSFTEALGAGFTAMEAFNWVLITNPIGLVITAIGLLAGAAYLIYKNWGPIKKFFGEVWDGLVSGVKKAWTLVEPYLKKIGEFFLKFSGIGQAIKVFQAAKGFFGGGDDTAPAPRPMLGVGSAPPPAYGRPPQGRVTIDIPNLPRGAKVTTDKSGTQPLDLDLGYSMVGS